MTFPILLDFCYLPVARLEAKSLPWHIARRLCSVRVIIGNLQIQTVCTCCCCIIDRQRCLSGFCLQPYFIVRLHCLVVIHIVQTKRLDLVNALLYCTERCRRLFPCLIANHTAQHRADGKFPLFSCRVDTIYAVFCSQRRLIFPGPYGQAGICRAVQCLRQIRADLIHIHLESCRLSCAHSLTIQTSDRNACHLRYRNRQRRRKALVSTVFRCKDRIIALDRRTVLCFQHGFRLLPAPGSCHHIFCPCYVDRYST